LRDVDLFADLSAQEAAELDRMAPSQRVLRGELVFSQSQPSSSLFILKSGRIRVFRVTEDGKAMTMGILEPGAVFGEMEGVISPYEIVPGRVRAFKAEHRACPGCMIEGRG
jgi:CRP/FNR family transcriptional regulator